MTDLVARHQDVALIDLLDRILTKGVYIRGDLILSVADVDLVYLSLKVMLSSVDKARQMREMSIAHDMGDGP